VKNKCVIHLKMQSDALTPGLVDGLSSVGRYDPCNLVSRTRNTSNGKFW